MDSSLSFFKLLVETEKYSHSVNKDFIRHVLQTNGKLFFFKFWNHFINELHIFKIIVALGLASEAKKHLCWSARVLV